MSVKCVRIVASLESAAGSNPGENGIVHTFVIMILNHITVFDYD